MLRWTCAPAARFAMTGTPSPSPGIFVEVQPPHRLVQVEHFSGDPTYRVESTVTLAARGTGTRMTNVLRYADAAARAAAIENGFTDGLDDVYGRLDALDIPG